MRGALQPLEGPPHSLEVGPSILCPLAPGPAQGLQVSPVQLPMKCSGPRLYLGRPDVSRTNALLT